MRRLTRKILQAELAAEREQDKLRLLQESLDASDLRTLPGRWIRAHGPALLWEDNLLALAEHVWGLAGKPLGPDRSELERYRRSLQAVLGGTREGSAR